AALMQNKLCAEKDVTGVASRGCAGGRVDEWLGGEQQLQPLRHSELHDFVDAGARRKFCRVPCPKRAGLELQIAERSESSRRGDSGPAGIGFKRVFRLGRGFGILRGGRTLRILGGK